MTGTSEDHKFAMALSLQIAKDSGRVFVPPLRGTLLAKNSTGHELELERYIWRLFPVALWSDCRSFFDRSRVPVRVVEPNFVAHAASALRKTRRHDETTSHVVHELEEPPLWIDLSTYRSYDEMMRALRVGYYGQTRVVSVEHADRVRDKEGWKLRREFEDVVEMCYEDLDAQKHRSERDGPAAGVCAEVCRPPSPR